MKLRIGETIQIKTTPDSLASLRVMGIKKELAGKKVSISQVTPHGVSFELPWTGNPSKLKSPVELHLGIGHVKAVFGKTA